jgi:hypothetical protein
VYKEQKTIIQFSADNNSPGSTYLTIHRYLILNVRNVSTAYCLYS